MLPLHRAANWVPLLQILAMCTYACVRAQSCPTLCNPVDCSPPGSSVPRIFQARRLEWVSICFSIIFLIQELNPRLLHWPVDSLPAEPPGKPFVYMAMSLISETACLVLISCKILPVARNKK